MSKYTNQKNIALPFAVLLATDTYDMVPAKNRISVTTLMRSVRQIVLGQRNIGSESSIDVSDLVSSGIGSAIHGGLERAWEDPTTALRDLGTPEDVISRVRINPTEPEEGTIPIYTELRSERVVKGISISGCCDLIMNQSVQDYKTTGIFAWSSGSNDSKYVLQLSMYRWLNLDKVTSSIGYIHFFFRDWSKLESSYKSTYPQLPMLTKEFQLLSPEHIDNYVEEKIDLILEHINTPEADLPYCSPEDLWQGKPAWQYFGSVGGKKASKNFSSLAEANTWLASKGKGEVRYKPAKVKACAYCNVRAGCSQATQLKADGLLD